MCIHISLCQFFLLAFSSLRKLRTSCSLTLAWTAYGLIITTLVWFTKKNPIPVYKKCDLSECCCIRTLVIFCKQVTTLQSQNIFFVFVVKYLLNYNLLSTSLNPDSLNWYNIFKIVFWFLVVKCQLALWQSLPNDLMSANSFWRIIMIFTHQVRFHKVLDNLWNNYSMIFKHRIFTQKIHFL